MPIASYAEEIAAWRLQRQQDQQRARLEDIRVEHAQAARERDQAIADNDLETAEMRDNDCQYLEQEWREIAPPPQTDPRLVQFARKNASWLQRYGQRGYQVLDEAHAYIMRRRNPNTNDPRYTGMGWKPEHVFSPQYFNRLQDLLETHGEALFGVKYDRNEELPTATEIAKISGLSPQAYNHQVRMAQAAGKFGKR